MDNAQHQVVALWVLHTYCIEFVHQTPYLAITSPEKQCGKSRLLECLDVLTPRPWVTVLPSEAVMFRNIHLNVPTLLLDETDTIFNPKTADRYEGHRALLNAGHRRGARVARCVGTSQDIAEFDVFCAKALAGIGVLPDTITDRSVPIRLARKKTDEPVERFRRRDVEPEADALKERCERWAATPRVQTAVAESRPVMPDELSDRMQEGCEVLVALAEILGCGDETRAALVELLTGERLDSTETMRLRLLRDVQAIFEEVAEERGKQPRGLFTRDLLTRLIAMEEAPWGSYYQRGIEDRDIATLLGGYGIESTQVKYKGQNLRGYRRDDLHEAWDRYL